MTTSCCVFISSLGARRPVSSRWSDNRILEEPLEEQASPSGVAVVKAEGKFVEVGIQILSGQQTVVGAEQPAFEQGCNGTHPWHGRAGRAPEFGDVGWLVDVSLTGESLVALSPAGAHLRARFDRGRDKSTYAVARDILDTLQAYAAEFVGR